MTVFVAKFDERGSRRLGEPRSVLDGVQGNGAQGAGGMQLSVSPSGSLVYIPAPIDLRRLVWLGRDGHEEPVFIIYSSDSSDTTTLFRRPARLAAKKMLRALRCRLQSQASEAF